MATTKFNSILLEVFQRLKDPIANATLSGTRYNNILISYHLNRAIRGFLLDKITTLGIKEFPDAYPEYVKVGGALTLVSGVVLKPTDCFMVIDLNTDENPLTNIHFQRIEQYRVEDVKNGRDAIIVPSATKPVFWEEGSNINTLGLTSGNVIPRYIITHIDIAPTVGSGTNGNFNSASGAFTAATRTLVATMNSVFTANDVNKKIFFRSATITYSGYIQSYVNATTVILSGNNLPLIDIAMVAQIIVSDSSPDSSDLLLNPYWFGEIVERTMKYALLDTKETILE